MRLTDQQADKVIANMVADYNSDARTLYRAHEKWFRRRARQLQVHDPDGFYKIVAGHALLVFGTQIRQQAAKELGATDDRPFLAYRALQFAARDVQTALHSHRNSQLA